ncbi:MAG: PilN domain-containing protein [Cyanobacteria bacterium P01_H01_bin.15]
MYSLDINFLKDRHLQEDLKTGTSIPADSDNSVSSSSRVPLLAGIAVMLILPLAALGFSWQTSRRNQDLQQGIQEIEGQIQQLNAQDQQLDSLRSQLEQSNAQTQAYASIFNQIRPLSSTLQEVTELIPAGVQLNSLTLNSDEVILSGVGRTYDDVNNFLLLVQESPYFAKDATQLSSSSLSVADSNQGLSLPDDVTVELPEVVSYNIRTRFSGTPASELLEKFSSQGAVGLVTRIRTLEREGAITR